MPSPIGHALAGAAIAFSAAPAADLRSSDDHDGMRRLWILAGVCAALAAAPDLDLAFPYTHRTVTHSLIATGLVTILAAVVTGQVTARNAWRLTAICAAAFGSHLLLDWMAVDDTPPRGLQLLWPFSDRWYISGWDLFRGTARRQLFTATSMRANALAIAQEIAILGPIAAAAWLVGVKAAARFPTEVTGGHHPAE